MKQKLAPTPIIRSKTITVADLLRKVKAVVLDEPRRLDLGEWLGAFRDRLGAREHARESAMPGAPECGTIGCISGWCAILTRKPGSDVYAYRFQLPHVPFDALTQLYSPNFGTYDSVKAKYGAPGTKTHARFVAVRIDNFLAAHPELEDRVIQVRP